MKRGLLLLFVLQLVLLSCKSTKPVIDNKLVLKDYQGPFKVFGIGYGAPGYNILTLTDANNKYITIQTPQNNSFIIGDTYNP